MKEKHDLQLVNTVKQLLAKQGDNVTSFEKQTEKFENQQTLIKTLSTRLNALESRNIELVEKVESQRVENVRISERLDKVERQNVGLVERVETQNVTYTNLNVKMSSVERKNIDLVGKVEILDKKLELVEKDKCRLAEKIESQKTDLLKLHNKDLKSTEDEIKLLEEKLKSEIENVTKILKERLNETQKSQIEKTNQHLKSIENQFKDYQNKIEALALFSSDLSRLLLTVSHLYFGLNLNQYFLFHEGEYADSWMNGIVDDGIKTWNNFTKEITERDQKFDGCDFLQNLKEAINQYSFFVYPKKQMNRYMLCMSSRFNDLSLDNNLKIRCPFKAHYISLKLCNTQDMLDNELQTKKYIQFNDQIASFYDNGKGCFYVAVFTISTIKRVLLIHPENENENMIVPQDGTRIDIVNKEFNNAYFYLFYFHE